MNNYTKYKMSGDSVFRQAKKQVLLLLFALTVIGNVANGDVLLETDFEGATGLPTGWTQGDISGVATWSIQTGGSEGGGNPSSANSGTNNATLYVSNNNENKTRLISPTFDSAGYTTATLTFYHTQKLWNPDQDELKVFYSDDGGSNWTELAHYTSDVSTWSLRTLNLPTTSVNSQIAFEANARYGYGVCLDDIVVTGSPSIKSTISISATDGDASEVGPDPGTWTITRAGNTTGDLSVNFTLSGNATQGSDYNIDTSSPISFAAGETTKLVTLTPLDDSVGEGYEVATLTLTVSTEYIIGDSADDITIFDDEGFDLNILLIGSTHSFSEGGENDVVHEKPFNPTTIATHLQSILSQDPALSDTVNVVFEDIFKTKTNTVRTSGSGINDITAHCYSLAQHFMWPDEKTTRLANLRGEAGTKWDYIIICNDPYIMANFPGMYAEGLKLLQTEVAQSSNAIAPQVILMAQWPENSSSFTADDFNEIVHRVGSSSGLTVAPAGKIWDSYTSQDTNAAHPTPRGEYLAAASIYSKLYNRSAKTSGYSYASDGDNIADHAQSVVQANASAAQYSGTYTAINPFQMKYVAKRVVSYRQTGTSTERGMYQALHRLDDVHRITFNTTAVNGKWDFNYGRGNDRWEDNKDYEVAPLKHDRAYGFPMHHYYTTDAPFTMPYGIDKYYYGSNYEDGTDLGIAYNMIRPNTREDSLPEDVRAIPIRLMWLKMEQASPGFNPLRDNTHMSNYLDDASTAFMYTLLSGRCPVVEEPATQGSAAWLQWLGHKVGYETAWQMSHLTTRAPGFQVLPSSASATTVTPTTTETMTVNFAMQPQSYVTVTVTSSNTGAAIVGPKTLVFTPANYNTPQQVTVAGIPGATTSEAFDVQFITSSADEVYDGLSDSWSYTTNRSSVVVTQYVDNSTSVVNTVQNQAVAINLNATGSNAGNTVIAGPAHGSITWSGSGVIEYTPDNGYEGTDEISYAATVGGTQTIGCVSITIVIPNGQVSVSTSDGTAAEEATATGTWTISRLGETTDAIDVLFILSGTADLASDYTVSHTSPVTIPTGQSSVTITLTPIDDTVFGEGDESAVLKITPAPAYPVGSASAAITITDNDNNVPVVEAGTNQTVTLSGSSAWTPADITTSAWFDANDASSITESSGAISQWNDKSGNSNHMKQSNAARQPTYLTNDPMYGGMPSVYSPASWHYLDTDAAVSVKRIYSVLYYADGTTQFFDNHNCFLANSTTSGDHRLTGRAGGNQNLWDSGNRFCDAGSYRDGSTTSSFTALAMPATVWKFDSSVARSQRWRVLGNTASYTYWHGGVGEIIFTDGNEDLATQQKAEGYLAHKWGLAANLPTGHPYEVSPPGVTGIAVNLDGDVTDTDGDPLITTWSVEAGPASVSFEDSTAVDTIATFIEVGTYVLRLTANDGFDTVLDEVTVTVNAAASPLYTIWTGGTFDKSFVDTDPTSNPDGDTITNQQEFAFGTDPTLNNGGSLAIDGLVHGLPIPASMDAGVTFDFYFLRRKDHATSGSITYTPQFSSDLSSFSASVDTPAVVVESTVDAAYEVVKVPYAAGTRFGRVKTDVTP